MSISVLVAAAFSLPEKKRHPGLHPKIREQKGGNQPGHTGVYLFLQQVYIYFFNWCTFISSNLFPHHCQQVRCEKCLLTAER